MRRSTQVNQTSSAKPSHAAPVPLETPPALRRPPAGARDCSVPSMRLSPWSHCAKRGFNQIPVPLLCRLPVGRKQNQSTKARILGALCPPLRMLSCSTPRTCGCRVAAMQNLPGDESVERGHLATPAQPNQATQMIAQIMRDLMHRGGRCLSFKENEFRSQCPTISRRR